jgi:class 3 adenylate cyclase
MLPSMPVPRRADTPLGTGTVTFVFTDIEGSTRLRETEPARMAEALARHDRLCRATVETHGGQLVKMVGDGLHAVFGDPAAAVAATLELQRGMAAISSDCGIPFKMRCGLHAGAAEARDGDFFGTAVNRAARIVGAAHGGQILLSQAVVALGKGRLPDGADLMHLGRVRLRDLSGPRMFGNCCTPICRARFRHCAHSHRRPIIFRSN